jgi:hypothetical protein
MDLERALEYSYQRSAVSNPLERHLAASQKPNAHT